MAIHDEWAKLNVKLYFYGVKLYFVGNYIIFHNISCQVPLKGSEFGHLVLKFIFQKLGVIIFTVTNLKENFNFQGAIDKGFLIIFVQVLHAKRGVCFIY